MAELVSADWVFPLNHKTAIAEGALLFEGDKIVAVGPRETLEISHPHATHQHFAGHVILPGLINAHVHLDRAGFAQRFKVETGTQTSPIHWLLEGLQYLTKTPASIVNDCIQQEVENALAQGVTCIGSMNHYEGTYPLLAEYPIRGVCFHEILSGPDKRAQQRFEIALALLEQYKNSKKESLKLGLGPYAAYLLSRNLLNIIAHHAKDNSLPIAMHAAEHFSEMEFFFESTGEIATKLFPSVGWHTLPPPHRKTPIQHLTDIGFFAGPTSLIGGFQLSDADFPRLAKGLARLVYCPSAAQRFQLGTFPVKRLQEIGVPIGLGTEVMSETENYDLWNEMRIALSCNPDLNPFDILKMATIGGAFNLCMETDVGSLEVGKKADFIVVKRTDNKSNDPQKIALQLIRNTEVRSVNRVYIGGTSVKEGI